LAQQLLRIFDGDTDLITSEFFFFNLLFGQLSPPPSNPKGAIGVISCSMLHDYTANNPKFFESISQGIKK
jgi:hypothetical protein